MSKVFKKRKNNALYFCQWLYVSLLNKAGEIGIRFSKEVQEKYIQEFQSSIYKSYGAVMKGYVLIPDCMLEDLENVSKYLNESYDYIMTLDPK